jgi:hypothetical protein
MDRSEMMRVYRTNLFTRIVPTMKDIGLWGPRIRKAYADMNIIGYAENDVEAMSASDERAAEELEARLSDIRQVAAVAAQ